MGGLHKMANDKRATIYTPNTGESVRHLHQTKEDRARNSKEFKEQKEHERKLKEERFAAIRNRQKNRPSGSGGGINIEVTGNK